MWEYPKCVWIAVVNVGMININGIVMWQSWTIVKLVYVDGVLMRWSNALIDHLLEGFAHMSERFCVCSWWLWFFVWGCCVWWWWYIARFREYWNRLRVRRRGFIVGVQGGGGIDSLIIRGGSNMRLQSRWNACTEFDLRKYNKFAQVQKYTNPKIQLSTCLF